MAERWRLPLEEDEVDRVSDESSPLSESAAVELESRIVDGVVRGRRRWGEGTGATAI